MTLPVLNNAKCCIFFITGAAKAQIIKVCLESLEVALGCSITHTTTILIYSGYRCGQQASTCWSRATKQRRTLLDSR